MQWLNELPFADNRVLQIGFLLACGIAALIVIAIFYRLAFAHRLRVPGGRTRQPRLGLVDAFSLDGQRQLVLVRRDNVEHLVMIGGPNDVLVESQINRAVAPARENAPTSPLLVPSTPMRRTEASAPPAAEAPAPVVAKIPVSPPTPARASQPAPAAVSPLFQPTPAAAPAIPKTPAAAPASAPAPAPKPMAPELPRPASAPPPAAQAPQSARPAPASSPMRPAEPRPAQPRPAMPPPIIPANTAANRATGAPPTEATSPRSQSNSPAPSPGALAPRRPEKPEQAGAAAKAEPVAAPAKAEPPAGPTVIVPAAGGASSQPRPATKTASSAPASNGAQKSADARPPADKTSAAPSGKAPPKVDDPFADLDSLEAEMARLLGREKSD